MSKNHELLKRISEPLELDVSRETFEQFVIYKNLLKEWNQKMNLTAITEDDEIFLKHFADSITIFNLNEVKKSNSVIDVGTGAGFPGLPMKIMKPSIELTCLDPLNKRLNFLREVSKELGFNDISFIHGRAEDVSRETSHRDHYDLAVSRAVALLPTLMEFCLPFVAEDKYFVAMKGPEIKKEISVSKRLFSELSAQLVKVQPIVDLDEYEHNLVLIRKTGKTKKTYPRKFTQIKKDNQMYKDLLTESKN